MERNYLKIITATLLFGSIGLFVRAIPLPSASIALVRAALGAAVLLAAALAAQGTSTLSRLEHLYRGYAQLLPTLRELGANVWLMTQDSVKSEDSCAYLARMDFDTVAEHAGRIAAI